MAPRISLILWGFLFLCYVGRIQGFLPYLQQAQLLSTESVKCSGDTIRCRDGSKSVKLEDVCRNGRQCSDGSDEDPRICSVWPSTHYNCNRGKVYCRNRCVNVCEFCLDSNCRGQNDKVLCEIVNKGRLWLKEDEDEELVLTEQLVGLMQKAVNITKSSKSCPMFFTLVGEHCLSFFSPAKVSWPEARQFCVALGGDLVSVNDLIIFKEILDYMTQSHLTSNYWTGGRFDEDDKAWTWVQDDTAMPLGSPYWGTRYNSDCVPRPPPHSDPYSSPSKALPGAPCFQQIQAPSKRAVGWCAAMTYEHYHVFTDEPCEETYSPLCQLTIN
ncbi:uncharacterized protein [Palaemon carinicauda]|uniref:uncharacterized protein isoform X1 n=1 Tax=Palaemon carinicauda TaxID=392227 RepID=UPI0035B5CAB3